MLGQLVYMEKGRGRPAPAGLHGMRVLRAEVEEPGGWLQRRGMDRAARRLSALGVRQVLTPREFAHWDCLERWGLERVDPGPLIRFFAAPLMLTALKRQGADPGQLAAALRGPRVDRDMVRCARMLCPHVRFLEVDAGGGDQLADWLRREYGMPVLPGRGRVQASVSFGPGQDRDAGEPVALRLWGLQPDLAGSALVLPRLEEGDRRDLRLLCALWQAGKVAEGELEFT